MPIDQYLLQAATDAGVRLEKTGELHTWEIIPPTDSAHALAIGQICQKLDKNRYINSYRTFPDGSVKCPDIFLWRKNNQTIIEVIQPGFEYKDYELNPKFYLQSGIDDYVVFNPLTNETRRYFYGMAGITYEITTLET